MFRSSTAAEPIHDVVEIEQGDSTWNHVPLSVLELELAAPGDGWAAYLSGRGVAVELDDIGRLSVTRETARLLIAEQREHEARAREAAQLQEQQAIERDQRWRASLPRGIPVGALPEGMTVGAAAWVAEHAAMPHRRTPVEAALDGTGMVFHSYQATPDDE